jgi:hypothetical protein
LIENVFPSPSSLRVIPLLLFFYRCGDGVIVDGVLPYARVGSTENVEHVSFSQTLKVKKSIYFLKKNMYKTHSLLYNIESSAVQTFFSTLGKISAYIIT